MLNPKHAGAQIRKHFAEVSPERFIENVERYCPDMIDSNALATKGEQGHGGQLILFQPQPAPLPLNAYLACALSNLNAEQRQLMFTLSDVVSVVCNEQSIDLYEPRKKTDPVHHPDVSDIDVFKTDRERVLSSDLLIHLCHYPSTGSGEELDFAYSALLPIILISHSETRVSRMITGIPSLKLHITYTEPEDLRMELRDRLAEIRPILEQRKLAFSKYEVNVVGEKIRLRREELGLTRENVAASAPQVTIEALTTFEESTDRCSNLTLIQLREIATILKTTVADLVEPDLNERLMSNLQEWMMNGAAARSGFSTKDRNRLLRRVLLRITDSLEE